MQSDFTHLPAYDPDGSRLSSIMEAAALRYNHILRDNWSIAISFRYSGPGSVSNLAHTFVQNSVEVRLDDGRIVDRTIAASIVFAANVDWYFDPTPRDDLEFNLTPVTYAELTTERQQSGFVGQAPPRLEVAHQGPALPGITGIDALTVAMHELGHALGVIGSVREASDGAYNIDPRLVHGNELAVLAVPNNLDHLQSRGTLMGPHIGARTRTLPSATDIFAMAAGSGWQQIDLPRKEFWGGTAWHHSINWTGNRLPDLNDDAFLRSGDIVSLGGEAQAGRLWVDLGTTLNTAGHRLHVRELHLGGQATLAVERGGATGDRLTLTPNATLAVEIGPSANTPLIFWEQANLAGTLKLSLASGYAPKPGDAHPLLLSPQIAGAFQQVSVSSTADRSGLEVLLMHDTLGSPGQPGMLERLTAQWVLQGDVNGDGSVDQADLDIVLLGWGGHALPVYVGSGDLDGSGRIDQADLDRVLLGWGRAAGSLSGASVPEPSTAGLLAAACGGLAFSGLRRFMPTREH